MTNTILLADDSVTIRKVVELTFMDEDFDLVSAGNGTEALERFDSNVDLVIADVHMPGSDGYQVCEKVKQQSSKTPVLLLVGTFESFDEKKASQAGADGHLKKPFDSQELLARVHELLAQSAEPAEPAEPEKSVESDGGSGDSEPASTADVFGRDAEEPALGAEAPGGKAQAEERGGAETSRDEPDEAEGIPSMAGAPVSAIELPVQELPAAAASAASVNETSDVVLSEESIDRIARRVVELLSEDALREVAWEVIPDLAEVVIKERLNELESQVDRTDS